MVSSVIKHRAPKGALRANAQHCQVIVIIVRPESTKRHKAHYDPDSAQSEMATASVGKHRAPKGALRLLTESHGHLRLVACESTEHQKMH